MPVARPTDGIWTAPTEELVGAQLVPGVWMSALPFPNPLKHIFSYFVETDAGLVVIDLGWNTEEAWQVFLTGLANAGKSIDDVAGVVITHVHPDHYGLAARFKEASDAWIATHPAERPQLPLDDHAQAIRLQDMLDWMDRCGAPQEETDRFRAEFPDVIHTFSRVQPDVDLSDRVPVLGTSGSLVPVHTPGHTPGHMCFLDRERGVVFTGDHLLPRVTPNVSRRPTSDPDPLTDFTASLGVVDDLEAEGALTALPGHEWSFTRLHERLTEIDEHHSERLDEMADAVARGAHTVWEVSQSITWKRPFATLDARARRSALGETYSHLTRLHTLGRLDLVSTDVDRFSPASS